MVYEIEKKATLSEEEFSKVKSYLDKNAKFLEEKEMKTFLFRDPHYLRIRFVKNTAIVTYKTGDIGDTIRNEINLELQKNQVQDFLRLIDALGFKECSHLSSKRYVYSFDGLAIELNIIDHLGRILEVEAMTEDKSDCDRLATKVTFVLQKLGLKELPAKEYKKMITELYDKTLKPVQIKI